MKNFEKNYKSLLSKIQLPEEKNENIKLSILSSNKKKIFKYKYAFAMSLLLFLFGTTIVYGEEIIKTFKGYIMTEEKSNIPGYEDLFYHVSYFKDIINIPSARPFTEEDIGKEFGYDDIEKTLGIKLLKNSKFNKNCFELEGLNFNEDNQATSIGFSISMPIEKPNEEKKLSFFLRTQYFSQEEREDSAWAFHSDRHLSKYHIDSLGTDAFIFDLVHENAPEWAKDIVPIKAYAFFAYKGISYTVTLDKIDYKPEDFYEYLDYFEY